jgi:hypothetical protein
MTFKKTQIMKTSSELGTIHVSTNSKNRTILFYLFIDVTTTPSGLSRIDKKLGIPTTREYSYNSYSRNLRVLVQRTPFCIIFYDGKSVNLVNCSTFHPKQPSFPFVRPSTTVKYTRRLGVLRTYRRTRTTGTSSTNLAYYGSSVHYRYGDSFVPVTSFFFYNDETTKQKITNEEL